MRVAGNAERHDVHRFRRIDDLGAVGIAARQIERLLLGEGSVPEVPPCDAIAARDDAGGDEKLLCVPVNKTFPYYADVATYTDMPPIVLQQIEHFFTHYKDLEPGKWAKLNGWGDVDEAKRIIVECIERAKKVGF